MACSTALAGAVSTPADDGAVPLSNGSAARSSLPLREVGSDSMVAMRAGIMYSGRVARSASCSATMVGTGTIASGTMKATSVCRPSPFCTAHAAARTPSQAISADSMAPSSTRYPRSFTCASPRPK